MTETLLIFGIKLDSFPAGGDFCRLLITFANSLDTVQAVGPNLDSNCLTVSWYSWKIIFFLKKKLFKIQIYRRHKSMQNYPACKELNQQHRLGRNHKLQFINNIFIIFIQRIQVAISLIILLRHADWSWPSLSASAPKRDLFVWRAPSDIPNNGLNLNLIDDVTYMISYDKT